VLFNQLAQQYQLPLLSTDITPIRSILVGSNSKTLHLQQLLQQRGHLVACIRPTTVPENTARLRISLCSEHCTENIVRLLEDLADVF
jgi:8-amino-7-oxononanoate synthase